MKFLLLFLLLCTGCTSFLAVQTEVVVSETNRTERTTKVSATSFFDSKSELTKFRSTMTDKSQGQSIGNLSQESSGTNAVALAEALARGMMEGAVKGMAKP